MMITKRPSINTGTLVLFIAAMLVALTVAIVSSFKPAVLAGSASIQKDPRAAGSSSQIQVNGNFDAHDYYMTHPSIKAIASFDAYDYYMTHPKGFDAYDTYTINPKGRTVTNWDAYDYYMTHPKGFDR